MKPIRQLPFLIGIGIGLTLSVQSDAQEDHLPVIDMHMHGPIAEGSGPPIELWLEKLRRLNVQKVALTAYSQQLESWLPKAPEVLIPSLMFPCLVQAVDQCFPDQSQMPEAEWVRQEVSAGRIQMFGEVVTELFGIFPSDEQLEVYFAMAEEFDIPIRSSYGAGPGLGSGVRVHIRAVSGFSDQRG